MNRELQDQRLPRAAQEQGAGVKRARNGSGGWLERRKKGEKEKGNGPTVDCLRICTCVLMHQGKERQAKQTRPNDQCKERNPARKEATKLVIDLVVRFLLCLCVCLCLSCCLAPSESRIIKVYRRGRQPQQPQRRKRHPLLVQQPTARSSLVPAPTPFTHQVAPPAIHTKQGVFSVQ